MVWKLPTSQLTQIQTTFVVYVDELFSGCNKKKSYDIMSQITVFLLQKQANKQILLDQGSTQFNIR